MSEVQSPHLAPEREERARTALFDDWDPDTAKANKDALLHTLETPGWQTIKRALKRDRDSLMRDLIDSIKPREDSAEYENLLGQIRGLERIEPLLDGVILAGEEAERDG